MSVLIPLRVVESFEMGSNDSRGTDFYAGLRPRIETVGYDLLA